MKRTVLMKGQMKKKRAIKFLLISAALVVVVFVCMNYNWSNRLIKAIESENIADFENIMEEKHCFSVNMPAGAPWGLQFTSDFAIKTPLQAACEIGNYDMVKKLIDERANVNFSVFGAEAPLNAVIYADTYDRFKIGRLLIDNGADPEEKDSWGVKPIINLALNSPYSAVDVEKDVYCYDRKKDVDGMKLYKYLLEHVTNKQPEDPSTGENALIAAASMSNIEILNYIIENQHININSTDNDGKTALFLYPDSNDKDEPSIRVAEILINAGIDVSIKDRHGKTAYDYAMEDGNTYLAELIKP